MPPSAIFYSDTLVPCATNGVLKWSGLPNSRIPLRFIGHKSDEDTNDHDRVRLFCFIYLWRLLNDVCSVYHGSIKEKSTLLSMLSSLSSLKR